MIAATALPAWTLRPARPDDAGAVSAFAATSFCTTFAGLYAPEDLAAFLAQWNQPGTLAAQASDPAWALQLAIGAAGAPVGMAKLGPLDLPLPPGQPADRAIELHHLYLAPAVQGTGLAQAMMAWVLDTARQRGHRHLYLSVYHANHRAKAFYRRYGFVEVGRNPYRVGSQIDDDRIWRLDL